MKIEKIEYAPDLDQGNICETHILYEIKETTSDFNGYTLKEFLVEDSLPLLISQNAFIENKLGKEGAFNIHLIYTTHISPTEENVKELLVKQIPALNEIKIFQGKEVDFSSLNEETYVYVGQNELAQDYKPLTGYLQSEQDFLRYSEFLADEDMQTRIMYATDKYFKKYKRGQKPYLKVGSLYYIQNSVLPYLQLHSVAKDLALSGEVAFSTKILKDTATGFAVLQEIQAAVKENREPKHDYLRSLVE